MFIRYLCFSQICTWVTIGFLWAYASMLITVVLFRSQKQSQSHTLTHSHSCQELARFWAYQGNSLPSWILIDQSCLILAFYFFSFQEAQKKKKKVSQSAVSVRAFGIQAAPVADLQTLQNTSSAHGAWSRDGGWVPVVLWTSGLICRSHTDQHFWQASRTPASNEKRRQTRVVSCLVYFGFRNALSFFGL